MARYTYIAIEGVIGVGKTTLARMMRDAFQAELLLEVFEENPFLSDFYADRARYAFQTQIFFLLSRYRQQYRVVGPTLAHAPLISDYTFAKDRLFAHLNLANDELAMYERVHSILAEKIPTPDLVVYLRASLDTLMDRIAVRDRPYERSMSRDYIADVRQAYERFLADYHDAPVLPIDTDDLNWVRDPAALAHVVSQVRATLGEGHEAAPLPSFEAEAPPAPAQPPTAGRRRLTDFQRWQQTLDQGGAVPTDLYFDYIGFTQRVGELGAEMADIWRQQKALIDKAGNQFQALDQAQAEHLPLLRARLADCLTYLLKLSNDVGADLETAYLEKTGRKGEK